MQFEPNIAAARRILDSAIKERIFPVQPLASTLPGRNFSVLPAI